MIGEDAIAFLRSRPIAMLCTRDANNHPAEHECFLADIQATRVIGFVPAHLARNLAENVRDNGAAALVVSRQPGDHRSVQLKGRITAIGGPSLQTEHFAATRPFVEVYANFVGVDRARELWTELSLLPMYRVQLDVAQAFDQTPGPKAGRPLGAGQP
jgi:hypothetical protein